MGSLLLCRCLPTPGQGVAWGRMRPGTRRLQPPVCCAVAKTASTTGLGQHGLASDMLLDLR